MTMLLFNRFTVELMLGKGGSGTVYLVRDAQDSHHKALKVLHESLLFDLAALKKFKREARLLQKVRHPNIVPVLDFSLTDAGGYLLMPYFAGRSLRQIISADGPVPLAQALDIVQQLAHGLRALHRKQIKHGDIKPENILLSEEGTLHILDFGSATLTEHIAGHTESIDCPGGGLTYAYAAPERFSRGAGDHRVDIWSTGIVLYELLTGRRPFDGADPFHLMGAILKDHPPPLPLGSTAVVRRLQHVIDRTLSKEQSARYSSMDEFLADLRKARAALEAAADLPAEVARSRRSRWRIDWHRKRNFIGFAVTIAVLLLLNFRPPSRSTVENAHSATDRGLIAYYPFDGDFSGLGIVRDASGNGHDLEIDQAQVFAAQGVIGQAMEFFNGVLLADSNPLAETEHMTVALWVWCRDPMTNQKLLATACAEWPFAGLIVGPHNIEGRTEDGVQIFNRCPPSLNRSLETPRTYLLPETWSHWAFTYDGRRFCSYLQGQFTLECPCPTGTIGDCQRLHVGGWAPFSAYNFVGIMDDLRIYNRALAAEEIARLFEMGSNNRRSESLADVRQDP